MGIRKTQMSINSSGYWIHRRIKNKILSKRADGGEESPQLIYGSLDLSVLRCSARNVKASWRGTCTSRERNQEHFQLSPSQRTGWHHCWREYCRLVSSPKGAFASYADI